MQAPAIVHEDLLTFLAAELPHAEEELRGMLEEDPDSPERLAAALQRSSLAELPYTLATPVADRQEGAPLIAEGVRLSERMVRSLLSRQRQALDSPIGPVAFAPDEAVVAHYRRKVTRYLQDLVARVRGAETGSSGTLYKMIARSHDLARLEACFGEVVERLVASPQNLSALLPFVSRQDCHAVLARGVHTAFVAMAVLATHARSAAPAPEREAFVDLGMAALLQDLGLVLDPETPRQDHPQRSMEIAETLGAGPAVLALILGHHCMGARAEPSAAGPADAKGAGLRVLVATNVFVGKTCERNGQIFEAVKMMNHLAESDLLDRQVVRDLAVLFLPRVKSFVIEQANRLGKQCPAPGNTPILWPVTGGRVPVVFLCGTSGCPHQTAQVTRLAMDVPFELDGVTLATIAKGDYFTCPPLTSKLRQLHAVIEGEGATANSADMPATGPRAAPSQGPAAHTSTPAGVTG